MCAGHLVSDPLDRPGEDSQAVALKVPAHFVSGDKVRDFLAPESDWLDVRWCAEDEEIGDPDVIGFYRELPEADVIWPVLRPLSGADLRLVHKVGAEVNCRRLHDGQPVAHVVNQPTGC